MLRAKAIKHHKGETKVRDKILSSTDAVGKLASIPVITQTVNAINKTSLGRKTLDRTLGIHPDAKLPEYKSKTARKLLAKQNKTSTSNSKVALFTTCYHNYSEPKVAEDLIAVFEHNNISVALLEEEKCCGMPKLELGDLQSVEKLKDANIPVLIKLIDQGYDIVGPVPSCVLMFKQELPLMFPDDADVQRVKAHMYDPFEYLMAKHKQEELKTDFNKSLGKIFYHASCHLRVQNMGLKTRDLLSLVPDTTLEVLERCSGHDGTYGVKSEFHEIAKKICRPVVTKLKKSEADYYTSDCSIAGHHIANVMDDQSQATHPMSLLRIAYGI
jgi:Fe-S oxidoreductase